MIIIYSLQELGLNPEKCHFISIEKVTHGEDVFYYDKRTLKNSNEEEILGVTIDRKLTFHQHIKKMCRKAGQKLSVLLKFPSYLIRTNGRHYTSTMVKSKLNYCPLV